MNFMTQFTAAEILSLLGLVQSIYVLVYMLFRSGSFVSAIIPVFYFTAIAGGFFLDAAAGRWESGFYSYEQLQWLFWFSCVPLGVMLILQVAQITEEPKPRYFLLLLLIPITFLPGYFMEEPGILYISGLIVGALSLLAIWIRRDLLDGLHGNPRFGEERFWLIISLITLNVAFLATTLVYVSGGLLPGQWVITRTLLGIAFVYIAATSLFRIYPQIFRQQPERGPPAPPNAADQLILQKLHRLFERDKIYQEATYGRAELARELGIGEAHLSRLMNIYYGKTIPQILNEHRVADAQRLLKETDAPIQQIFEESGFNSITTFNRVFKDLVGEAPTEYRGRFRVQSPE
jgi:AraC-like DNA-binding protein